MRGEKTALLWKDPKYRDHMSRVHKWQTPPSRKGSPPNSGSFVVGHSRGIGKRFTDEHRRNLSNTHRGKVPWNKGLGTLTSERKRARNSIEYSAWRNAVYERNNYTCQKCNQKGGYLHPHHIESFARFPELRFVLDNGITLCKIHHNEFHKIYGLRKGFDKKSLEIYLNKKHEKRD